MQPSPFVLHCRKSFLQLFFVFISQSCETFELGGAVLWFEQQLLTATHEAAGVVPAIYKTQLRFLWVHGLL